MKLLVLLSLLLPLVALAVPPYQIGVAAGGNANPPGVGASPTNPAAFPVTPFNLGSVTKYRVIVCAKSSNIQSGTLRLWLWSTALQQWAENADFNLTPNYTGDARCGVGSATPDLSQGYLYPQLINATQSGTCTDTTGSPDCFTVRVEG